MKYILILLFCLPAFGAFRTDRTYVIVEVADLAANWFRDVDARSTLSENSISTVRKNLAGTLAIVKYKTARGGGSKLGAIPGARKDVHTHESILAHLGNTANGWEEAP